MNQALLNKLGWRINSEKNSLWSKVMVGRYGGNSQNISHYPANDLGSDLVVDYLLPNGWDIEKLREILPWNIIKGIYSIHTRRTFLFEDQACGSFLV